MNNLKIKLFDLAKGLFFMLDMYNLNIDPVRLKSLGFNDAEIQNLQYVVMNIGKLTPSVLTQCGYTYEQAARLKYLYDICIGKVIIETPDELSKHLRKMFGAKGRIGIQNLEVSKIKEVPRYAIVGNIKTEPFTIWNSKQYPPNQRLYRVVDVSSTRITVRTGKIPKIQYGGAKEVDGVLEIKGVVKGANNTKLVDVAFYKDYCKLCNRFIIVASLRRPEFHHGMVEIICYEGTRVYVYAQTLGTKELVKYNMGTQRIYDYGVLPQEINGKLTKRASELYTILKGAYRSFEPGNQDYTIIPVEKPQEDEDLIEE